MVRYFRRLPPLLRVAGGVGLMCLPAAIILYTTVLLTQLSTFPHWPVYVLRLQAIAIDLGVLGYACALVLHRYTTRLRRPARGLFALDSWQRQARALLLVAALPLCALAWAVIIPPTEVAFI
ncbi:MAG TPA: hypothetical protein VGS80_09170 [Ktedonobacterales bacterium]|nr:hypothetical protein [Ktedonobacterales bacterium]